MKIFTREEKRNKKLVSLYNKYVEEGMRPLRAAKMARKEINKTKQ